MKTYKRTPAEFREDVINALFIFLALGTWHPNRSLRCIRLCAA